MVISHLLGLPPGAVGPGSLYRIIAAAQQTFLKDGIVAVGPAPKYKRDAIRVRAAAKQAREGL